MRIKSKCRRSSRKRGLNPFLIPGPSFIQCCVSIAKSVPEIGALHLTYMGPEGRARSLSQGGKNRTCHLMWHSTIQPRRFGHKRGRSVRLSTWQLTLSSFESQAQHTFNSRPKNSGTMKVELKSRAKAAHICFQMRFHVRAGPSCCLMERESLM